MALRETYSNFGYFEMFAADTYNETTTMPSSGEQSSLSVDTQGYEAVTIIVNIGSCNVDASESCMVLRLMHAHSVTAASYDNVSTTDLIGSGWLVNSGAIISLGGGSALVSGIIMDFDIPTTSETDAQGTWAFGYKGGRRYLKLMLESTGSVTAGSIHMCAVAVCGYPANWPVNDPTP